MARKRPVPTKYTVWKRDFGGYSVFADDLWIGYRINRSDCTELITKHHRRVNMAKQGTEVSLTAHKFCDFDKANGKTVVAEYDAKTTRFSPGRGSWAYMCKEHFDSYTDGQLGTGVGQKLIYGEPTPAN